MRLDDRDRTVIDLRAFNPSVPDLTLELGEQTINAVVVEQRRVYHAR
jgi:hypothetical protein